MRLNRLRRVTLCCFLFCASCGVGRAAASGFGIFTQGAQALGQADAVVAHPCGPSTLFFNPALANRLPGTQFELGSTGVVPRRSFRGPDGESAATRDRLFLPSTFYLTHAVNDRLSVGLAVFNPFGLGTDWGDRWSGRYLTTNAVLESYAVNPVLSLQLTPAWSLAAGVDLMFLDARLENLIPTAAGAVAQRFSGRGRGVGYNLGLALDLFGPVTLGVSYRSPVYLGIDGSVAFELPDPALAALFPNGPGRSSIRLPQQLFVGLALRSGDRFALESGFRWEDWSSFSSLRLSFSQPVAGNAQITLPREWVSTFAVNLGGRYRLTDRLALSAGYLYGFNPVPDRTFEPAIPDADSHLFCLGGELSSGRFTVALGYGYQILRDRNKGTNDYGPLGNGRYHSELHLIGVSLGARL